MDFETKVQLETDFEFCGVNLYVGVFVLRRKDTTTTTTTTTLVLEAN